MHSPGSYFPVKRPQSLKWTAEQKRRLAEFVEKNPDLVATLRRSCWAWNKAAAIT
jgi:hypothetical protein